MFLLHFEEARNAMDPKNSAGIIEEWLFLNACQTISRSSFTEVLQSALTIALDGDIVFSVVDQEIEALKVKDTI